MADSSNRDSNRVDRRTTVAKLAGVLIVAGVLVAGVLLPYVGGLGVVGRNEAQKFLNSSCDLTETPPPQKTTVYASDGKTLLATLFTQDRTPVTYDQVPTYLINALVDTEDRRFYSHHGVDLRGLLRSAVSTSSGDTQGGSTLTMQYVKQVRYYQATTDAERAAAIDQNINRKIEDARCALEIEKREDKKQILTNYLNITTFGENSFGIGTAARTFFNTTVDKLTVPQAALLVGLVRAPGAYDPFIYPEAAKERRNQVIQNLVNAGHLSAADGIKYMAAPDGLATATPPSVPKGCINTPSTIPNAGFFCDYAVDWLENTGGISDTVLNNGGLKIVTTLSPTLQTSIQKSLTGPGGIAASSPSTSVMPVVDPKTGDVLAMGTSKLYGLPTSAKDKSHTSVKMFTDNTTTGASTYKYFSLIAALEAGVPASLALGQNANGHNSASSYVPLNCGTTNYVSSNSDPNESFNTNETLTSAIAKSSNTYFTQFADQVFSCNLSPIINVAQNLGLSQLTQPVSTGSKTTLAQSIINQQQLTFLIGANVEVSPLALAGAYAAAANDGVYCPPRPILSITGPDGKAMAVKAPACSQQFSPQVAREAVQILEGDTQGQGTSRTSFANYYGQNGSQVAGKTGTQAASDAKGQLSTNAALWFVGLTPTMAATTAVLNLDSPASPLRDLPGMSDAQAGNTYGFYAAQIWVNALQSTLLTSPWSWPSVDNIPNGVTVPLSAGESTDQAESVVKGLGLKFVALDATDGLQCASTAPYGTIAYFSPTVAAPGSTVTYCPSTGSAPTKYTPPVVKTTPPTSPGASGTSGATTKPPTGATTSKPPATTKPTPPRH